LSTSRARVTPPSTRCTKSTAPVVRVAPDQPSISSIDGVRLIYGPGTTCVKSPAYDHFGRKASFQMRDPEEHRQRYKRVAHCFSAGSLQQMEPLIHTVMAKLASLVERNVDRPLNMLHWCRMTALDISGKLRTHWSCGVANS